MPHQQSKPTRGLSLRVPPEVWEQVDQLAKSLGVTKAAVVEAGLVLLEKAVQEGRREEEK